MINNHHIMRLFVPTSSDILQLQMEIIICTLLCIIIAAAIFIFRKRFRPKRSDCMYLGLEKLSSVLCKFFILAHSVRARRAARFVERDARAFSNNRLSQFGYTRTSHALATYLSELDGN